MSIAKALFEVNSRIEAVTKSLNLKTRPRLVAVSKTKSVELIKECYDAGQRVFGENYAQELTEKAKQLPSDIEWHFIGTLQSNKIKMLLSVPNLTMIETVHSKKLAQKLDKECQSVRPTNPLKIMVEVNTSGEETKSGIQPNECPDLVKYIINDLKYLKFCGLMTIGRPNAPPDQPDFRCLLDCRKQICEALSLDPNTFELSMGMSQDFEDAIRFGSTNVRVGTNIFGARDYSQKH